MWVYDKLSFFTEPITAFVASRIPPWPYVAEVLVFVTTIVFFAATGALVKIRIGKWLHDLIEWPLKKIPLYSLVKKTVSLISGKENGHLFSAPAKLVIRGEDGSFLCAFNGLIVDRSEEKGLMPIFIRTAPTPSTGVDVDLPLRFVVPVEAGTEEVVQVALSCGKGSLDLWRGFAPEFFK